MMVKILTLTGDELEIDAEATDTIQSLKEKLEERQGIPTLQQRLIFQGKKLKDDSTLKSYKIIAGSILHLVVALRGGLPSSYDLVYNNSNSFTTIRRFLL